MGTDCHVMVVGPGCERRLEAAITEIQRLEQLWSRFLAESEVSELNERAGHPVPVSGDTLTLIERAVLARNLTAGRFNPFMGRRICELGYEASFSSARSGVEAESAKPGNAATASPKRSGASEVHPWDGCEPIVDRRRSVVALPAGVSFDPGGIGKGLAADLVSETIMANGAWGVLVNLGGDLRVRGTPATGDRWVIQIEEPAVISGEIAVVALHEGALATSTTGRRRWGSPGQELHHLINPNTGLPNDLGPQLASVIAGDAWWAEVVATSLCATETSGALPQPEESQGDQTWAALTLDSAGAVSRVGGFAAYEVDRQTSHGVANNEHSEHTAHAREVLAK